MIDLFNYKWTTDDGSPLNKSNPWMWHDCDAVYVDNGTAELNAYREPKQLQDLDGNIYNPTVACGMLRSVDTFGYGIFSAEIMLPKGKNLWPAFWLCGSGEPWPKAGEIDIMEAWTNRLGGYFKLGIPQPPYIVPSWDTTTNIHWQEDDGRHGYTGSRRLPLLFSLKRPAHNFIKYEVEWRPDIITFQVNGKRVRTYGYHVAKRLNKKRMRVIFDLWTTKEDFRLDSPMNIRNFEYKPLEIL
jgi:beta-glucanase (GH16 family)